MKLLLNIILCIFIFTSCDSQNEDVHGCFDSQACNYNPNANIDNNNCIYESDCNGECGGEAVLDECGVCEGSGVDFDQDNICDDVDECIGYYDDCGICNGNGTDFDQDGICDFVDDCVGQYDDCGVCNGSGNDIDQDGICDDADDCIDVNQNNICDNIEEGCTNSYGIFLDNDLDGICDLMDECPFDNNNDLDDDGICDNEDDCIGQYDDCGVCNGNGTDLNENGICDDLENCQSYTYFECLNQQQCQWNFSINLCEDYELDCEDLNFSQCSSQPLCEWDSEDSECDD